MTQTPYIDPAWKDALAQAGYTDFDSWWDAEGSLVEEGNFRGNDNNKYWSHVSRIDLADGRTVYLKRQQNHYPNNLILKWRRLTTFEIEWANYNKFQKAGIPTMNIVYFAHRKTNGNRQSILVSEELKGMTSLHDLIIWSENHQWPNRSDRLRMIESMALVVKKLHASGIIHNALYGRHLYINVQTHDDGTITIPETLQCCFIDLERAKYPGANSPKMISKDLQTMHNKSKTWPSRDKLLFLKKYLGINKLTPRAKAIARQLNENTK